jgi:ribose transport system substrate-binding protein
MEVTTMARRSCAALAVLAAVGLAACSNSGSSSTAGGTSISGAASSTSSPGAVSAGKASAIKITQQYTEHPSAFPVTGPLPKLLPPGTTFGYLQCVAPVCAQLAVLMRAAVTAIHGRLIVVQGGSSTQQLQAAFQSLLSDKPDALLLPGIEPDQVAPELAEAKSEGIPMASTGIMDIGKWDIGASAFGQGLSELVGKLQADWVVANEGTNPNIVFYTTNELDFFVPEEAAFKAELSTLGCKCAVRTVDIPIATYGSSAPGIVVSDLESHPNTTIAVFGANDPTTGLVAAMKAAGLTTPYIGYGPTPSNLVDIQDGNQAAGLGLDYPAIAWTMVDEDARLLLKAPLTPDEQQSLVPIQWLTKSNIDFNIQQGWTGYADYASRFEKLWLVG